MPTITIENPAVAEAIALGEEFDRCYQRWSAADRESREAQKARDAAKAQYARALNRLSRLEGEYVREQISPEVSELVPVRSQVIE